MSIEVEVLKVRVGILEMALSTLIQSELQTLQPYGSSRWTMLNNLNDMVIRELRENDTAYYQAIKETTK